MATARLVSRADVPAPNWDLVPLRHDQCIVGKDALEAMNAMVARLQTENQRLRLALHNSRHQWTHETDTRLYRCDRCGMRARTPNTVLMTCEEWQRDRADGRRRTG